MLTYADVCRCNISFGAYAHKSKLVADVTPAQEQVALEEELIWHMLTYADVC